MKDFQIKLILLLLCALSFPFFGSAQDSLPFELSYEVNKIYPPLSMTKEKLGEAQTIMDINPFYKPAWIKEYISTEVIVSHRGEIKNAMGENAVLSQQQKDLMSLSDMDTKIDFKVRYIPDNTLSQNDIKEINFDFTIDPEKEAKFPGGRQQLEKYLKENVGEKISKSTFRQHHLSAVKFTINEEGRVINAHVFESSGDEKADQLLLSTIDDMPNWKPAEYTSGLKVKQECVLTVGDMKSCVLNLLNIRGL